MTLKFAALVLVACVAAGCASAPKIYVINETGQALRGGIRDVAKIELANQPGAQEVHGFPDHDWWLIAGPCVYRYPAIAVGDPAWVRHQEAAHASGARDLLVRVSESFIVRAYAYSDEVGAMVADEVTVGGLPMAPTKSCS
ncbi:MAG TPA: hypothetical protein VGO52_21920 [Hyphomonadaceae bacterium]|nr:hypothetical protein [Hyphomonadaceae bacterium]